MPAIDPISKICACQFNIDPNDFEFALGNLNGPNLPGLTSLITGQIEAFVFSLPLPLIPLQFIIDGKIFDLLDYIATLTSDFPQFVLDTFKIYVFDPFTGKLKVYLPPFSINLFGLVDFPAPSINQGLGDEPPWNTLMWSVQTPAYIKLLIMLLLFPLNLIIEILLYIVNNLSFPSVGIDFLNLVWGAILAAGGFSVGTPEFESIKKLGNCVIQQLLLLLPFPVGGATSEPIEVAAFQGTTEIEDKGEFQFTLANVPSQFRLQRKTVNVSITDIQLSGFQASEFVIQNLSQPLPVILGSDPLTFDIRFVPSSAGAKEANIVILSDDPVEGGFSFKIKGGA